MILDPILKAEIADRLPAEIEKITQYFGSMVVVHLKGQGGWNARRRFNLCDWKLTQDGVITADSGSFGDVNNRVIEPLKGNRLVSFERTDSQAFEVRLGSGASFSLSGNLDEYAPEDALFTLWVNDEYGVDYSPGAGFRSGLE